MHGSGPTTSKGEVCPHRGLARRGRAETTCWSRLPLVAVGLGLTAATLAPGRQERLGRRAAPGCHLDNRAVAVVSAVTVNRDAEDLPAVRGVAHSLVSRERDRKSVV